MSYLRQEVTDGLPSINGSSRRGRLEATRLSSSLTKLDRLDDLDAPTRHVAFRPLSSGQDGVRSTYRAASPDGRSRTPTRTMSPTRARSPVRSYSPTRSYSPNGQHRTISDVSTLHTYD